MTEPVEQLIAELIKEMPDLAGKEGILRPLLVELLAARPIVSLNPEFRASLKRRLLVQGAIARPSVWRRGYMYIPLVGAVVAVLLLFVQTWPKVTPSMAPLAAVPVYNKSVSSGGPPAGAGQVQTFDAVARKSTTTMKLTSPAFQEGQMIPARYTCDGSKVSPPLTFADLPSAARSLALAVEDPDAPSGMFTHWTVWNIPTGVMKVEEGRIPSEAAQGMNSAGSTGYVPPCPPSGTHHYIFILYALDTMLDLPSSADASALYQAIAGHVLEQTSLTGLYSR